jgi:hypothetical protein
LGQSIHAEKFEAQIQWFFAEEENSGKGEKSFS